MTPTRPTIIEFMGDARVFGDAFAGRSWVRWKTVLRVAYGLKLTVAEKQWFRAHTGRSTYNPPAGG